MQCLPRGVKQEQGEKMVDTMPLREDELQACLEELVAELRVRSDPYHDITASPSPRWTLQLRPLQRLPITAL
ncbi:UNVERIFIED_CONTAM: hypothetical protein FKN15_002683 [Acipenser sinensis]